MLRARNNRRRAERDVQIVEQVFLLVVGHGEGAVRADALQRTGKVACWARSACTGGCSGRRKLRNKGRVRK